VCEVILVNKIDLIEWVDFDLDLFYQTVGALNPTALVFEISCRTGKGLPIWVDWLCNRKQALFGA
jgi:hydrogenase nickel incorporation protein HypB